VYGCEPQPHEALSHASPMPHCCVHSSSRRPTVPRKHVRRLKQLASAAFGASCLLNEAEHDAVRVAGASVTASSSTSPRLR
jgi:hypothetical protein